MAINKASLRSRINKLSQETGVHQNILLKSFFFEVFLRRLCLSKYVDRFVFKGGFLLSTSLGIRFRSTMDIDVLAMRIKVERESIASIFREIVSIEIEDGVRFEVRGIGEIRPDDEYGGFNVKLSAGLENIKETVSIDIATGDPITPEAIDYLYKPLFEDTIFHLRAYNFETILAEKLQTILFRGIANSRSKDFYDIYIIYKLRWNEIDRSILRKAFARTCNYRGTVFSRSQAYAIVERIKGDAEMPRRWDSYRKRNGFASDVAFGETISSLLALLGAAFSGDER